MGFKRVLKETTTNGVLSGKTTAYQREKPIKGTRLSAFRVIINTEAFKNTEIKIQRDYRMS